MSAYTFWIAENSSLWSDWNSQCRLLRRCINTDGGSPGIPAGLPEADEACAAFVSPSGALAGPTYSTFLTIGECTACSHRQGDAPEVGRRACKVIWRGDRHTLQRACSIFLTLADRRCPGTCPQPTFQRSHLWSARLSYPLTLVRHFPHPGGKTCSYPLTLLQQSAHQEPAISSPYRAGRPVNSGFARSLCFLYRF